MYSGLGFSALIFVVHGLIKHGWEVQKSRMSLDWMILMATFNIMGAVAYSTQVSDRSANKSSVFIY